MFRSKNRTAFAAGLLALTMMSSPAAAVSPLSGFMLSKLPVFKMRPSFSIVEAFAARMVLPSVRMPRLPEPKPEITRAVFRPAPRIAPRDPQPDLAPPSAYIRTSARALAPMGHVVFCMKHPAECAAGAREAATLDLSRSEKAQLRKVNFRVNRAINPRHDRGAGALSDQWSIAPRNGDCEDYALTKRHELARLGFSRKAMRVAVVKTPDGQDHSVLVVRTSEGDMVLDNLTDAILPWKKTQLTFVMIQSAKNPRFWRTI